MVQVNLTSTQNRLILIVSSQAPGREWFMNLAILKLIRSQNRDLLFRSHLLFYFQTKSSFHFVQLIRRFSPCEC